MKINVEPFRKNIFTDIKFKVLLDFDKEKTYK